MSRRLIVTADDFGLSPGVNAGVVEAHERGIVTSASLMIRRAAAAEAAEYARRRPELAVGLHVDLGEWVYGDGEWRQVEEVCALDEYAIADEVAHQVAAFRSLVGRAPTHLDSHQHVHQTAPAQGALRAASELLGVPLRHFTDGIRYCGDFYGQTGTGERLPEAIGVDALVRLLESLPPGTTELGCHPAAFVDFDSPYSNERPLELRALCDGRVRLALDTLDVELVPFAPAAG